MEYRKLGWSELNVSTISFGAWQIGDPAYWQSDTKSDQERTVLAAIDVGINLIDTAEMYGAGESERVLGQTLGARRDEVVLASKVLPENCAPEKLRAACEGSLERLHTDRIDLYQVHWPFRDVPFEAAYGELARLQEEGKIREIGVSNFGVRDLGAWFEAGVCVSDQLSYNFAFRAVEEEIIPECEARGVGVLAYSPLLQGILSCRWKTVEEIPQVRRRTRHFNGERPGVMHDGPGHEELLLELLKELEAAAVEAGQPPATLALAWLIGQRSVTSVIVGARNVAQLQRNLEAAELELDAALMERLDRISAPLKDAMGPSADMWRAGAEPRIR